MGRYVIRMGVFIAILLVLVGVLAQKLWAAFCHNMVLNGIILGVEVFGIAIAFYHIYRLIKEQQWLDTLITGRVDLDIPQPRILSPLATLSEDKMQLSPLMTQSIMNSVDNRLDDIRDMGRYLTGLLIFLGLIGTFWGLSQTIGAISGVISGININASDLNQAFANLRNGLQSPLSGMGTAFSSSMFGVVGSMILGFLELQITKAINYFTNNLEEILTTNTKFSLETRDVTHNGPAYTQSLLEQAAEQMNQLQNTIKRSEESRLSIVKSMQNLGDKLGVFTEQMVLQQSVLKKVAQGNMELQQTVGILREFLVNPNLIQDEVVHQYLRSVDSSITRLLEELVDGRTRSTQELRNEIRLVARTISALANGQEVVAA